MTPSVIGVVAPWIEPVALALLAIAGALTLISLAYRRVIREERRPLIDHVTNNGWDRGAVHLTDVVVTLGVLTTIMVLAPTLYKFIDMVTGASGPLTTLLLTLAVPVLFIALILSIGRQARRGGA